MPYVEQIMKKNFIEYASYVIKERSIPHIDDGCKPVQRRILHTLFSVDDGRFHKVANIVGDCTKYHPHGDAPIYEALVNLANKNVFIDKQGNFGNPSTGDPASAARYIECRINALAKELLYSPEITDYVDSYDGRNKEPITFPAKIPLILVTGAEGIAVVMATTMVPHNFCEIIQALIHSLQDNSFEVYPDFPSAAFIDVSEYNDGMGKIRMRAKLDTSNPKQIVITELPYGVTTEKLINSVENAAKSGKLNIAGISDYTSDKIEVVLTLPRGVYAKDIEDSLYAFTDCESSISLNPVVIHKNQPVQMSSNQIIKYYKKRTPFILKQELQVEQQKIEDKIHVRTLERIFIEEKVYKQIETCKTAEAVRDTTKKEMMKFKKEFYRDYTDEDTEHLLKIPIRRISAYDIHKHKKELKELLNQLKIIKYNIRNILAYTIDYLYKILNSYKDIFPRRTKIISFEQVKEKDVVQRNLSFLYDSSNGYMGYTLSKGKKIADISLLDKIILFKKNGTWMVLNVSKKQFIGKDLLSIGLVEKKKLENLIFTVIYVKTEEKKGKEYTYIKRFKVEKFLINKIYSYIPDGCKLLRFTNKTNISLCLEYKPVPCIKKMEDTFVVDNYIPKGIGSKGVRLSTKAVKKATIL